MPGGHLEYGEEVEACALREVAEETGIKVKNVRRANSITNDIYPEGKHYITLYVLCDYEDGEPELLEPHKCERWEWFSWVQ